MSEAGTERLTLKWGTLKAWKLNPNGPAQRAFERYSEAGPMSFGAMQQRDTPEQKQAICDLIDALDADTVFLEWDGKHVAKEEAKDYVLGYRR